MLLQKRCMQFFWNLFSYLSCPFPVFCPVPAALAEPGTTGRVMPAEIEAMESQVQAVPILLWDC